MDSVLQSSKAFVRDQRVFQGHVIEDPHMQPEDLDEDPTTVYYGGEVYSTNGLYVVNPPAPGTRGLDPAGIPSAVHDNYGYLPRVCIQGSINSEKAMVQLWLIFKCTVPK